MSTMRLTGRLACGITSALLLGSSGASASETINLRPGLWKVTTSTEKPFFGNPKTQTRTICLSAEKADLLPVLVRPPCVVTRRRVQADTLTWKSSCENTAASSPILGKGRLVARGDTMNGTMTTRIEFGATRMILRYEVSGTHTGACD